MFGMKAFDWHKAMFLKTGVSYKIIKAQEVLDNRIKELRKVEVILTNAHNHELQMRQEVLNARKVWEDLQGTENYNLLVRSYEDIDFWYDFWFSSVGYCQEAFINWKKAFNLRVRAERYLEALVIK